MGRKMLIASDFSVGTGLIASDFSVETSATSVRPILAITRRAKNNQIPYGCKKYVHLLCKKYVHLLCNREKCHHQFAFFPRPPKQVGWPFTQSLGGQAMNDGVFFRVSWQITCCNTSISWRKAIDHVRIEGRWFVRERKVSRKAAGHNDHCPLGMEVRDSAMPSVIQKDVKVPWLAEDAVGVLTLDKEMMEQSAENVEPGRSVRAAAALATDVEWGAEERIPARAPRILV